MGQAWPGRAARPGQAGRAHDTCFKAASSDVTQNCDFCYFVSKLYVLHGFKALENVSPNVRFVFLVFYGQLRLTFRLTFTNFKTSCKLQCLSTN